MGNPPNVRRLPAVNRCQGLAYVLTERDRDSANIAVTTLFSSERSAERAAHDYDEVYDLLNTRINCGAEIEVNIIENLWLTHLC